MRPLPAKFTPCRGAVVHVTMAIIVVLGVARVASADDKISEIVLRGATIQDLDEQGVARGPARAIVPTTTGRLACRIERRPTGVYKAWFGGVVVSDGEGIAHLTFIDARGGRSGDISTCAAQAVIDLRFRAQPATRVSSRRYRSSHPG